MKSAIRYLFTAIILLTVSQVFTEERPRVEFFSPEGTVKNVRQVTARFTDQMLPFGDMRAVESPFEIESTEKGTGRWADAKNWIFDFDRDLPAGVQCTFRLRPGLKTLAGKEIRGQREFSFSTGGPSVMRTEPYEDSTYVAEDQVFILTLDAEPDIESVKKNVYFSIEGIQDRPGVQIIEGKNRADILEAEHRQRDVSNGSIILVQCRQNFPSESQVSLVWGKGVQSKSGVATTQDQILRYRSREPFSASFTCERENADADCIPILPMGLYFTAPVPRDQAKKIVLKGKDGKTRKPRISDDELEQNAVTSVMFDGPFPQKSSFKIEIPREIKDEDGRPLVNADTFPLEVRTEKYPPLAKFAARFGLLELKADPALPVTLRNLEPDVKARMLQVGNEKGFFQNVVGKIFSVSSGKENVQEWLRKVGNAEREESILTTATGAADFKIPKKEGAQAFEVVGIPIKDPGLYVVEIESNILGASLLGKQAPMYVQTAVLVTNMSAHFKWGRESSLVWVTTLDTGDPVAGADVAIKDCNEKVLWQGKTDARGIAKIQGPIPNSDDLPSCGYSSIGSGLFITAKLGNDMTFVYSSWNDGIEPWRFQLPQEYNSNPAIARTVFDRTLLRAGETVHMKHIIRNHTMGGFSIPQADKLPGKLEIIHAGSEEKFVLQLKWDAGGTAHTSFVIPRDAKLGLYLLNLVKETPGKEGSDYELAGGDFRVEEFRIPLLKGTIKPPAEPLVNAKSFPLDINIRYLSGGGAGALPVKLRSEVRDAEIPSFEGYEDFAFCKGAVREGISRGGRYMYDEDYGEGGDESAGAAGTRLSTMELTLDRTGGLRVQVPEIPKSDNPRDVLTEMEFRDPNGELQTVSAKIPLWPSECLIGIKPDSWALSKDRFKFHTVVLDLEGKPVVNAPVRVKLLARKTYTHRKRLVGGFYAYEYTREIKKVADIYSGKTDAKGLLVCEVTVPESGNLILQAESEDKNGNRTITNSEVWVAGSSDWWFEVSDNDRIDLIPERKKYDPGETAVFQLRMPFRNATALVTVEREGVMESWVTKVSGKEPAIKVPVKGWYAPNCFVSALVVRGRITGVQPTALVDMGRPAYKLGISEIKVGWKAHELNVSVVPDRKVYTIREKSNVKIKVRTADGKLPPQNTEVAVAAVDEGLLELMPNASWDLLSGMMGQRPYEVNTSTAQMQVIGRRHFGLKAFPQGGGGGRQTTRELFDTLLLWKGKVVLDANGEAQVAIPLNDSITSFRIVAVANSTGFFGTGRASIQSTQDLMILAGLPPLVREGDRYRAGYTVRNTTGRIMEVEATVKAEGIADALQPVTVTLQAGEAKEIGWDIVVPAGIEKITWQVEATDKQSGKKDSMKTSQKVVAAVPVRTFQATITQVDASYRLTVERPADAVPGKGNVRVSVRPRIATGQTGISEYMGTYPYTCMEQRASVAVALRNRALWDKAMSDLRTCVDTDGLVKYFPTCDYGSPVLTAYILAIGNEAGWAIPEEEKEKMTDAMVKFVEGKIMRYTPLPTADLTIRKLSAIEALSRYGKAAPGLLDSISIDPNLWPTSAVIDWFNILVNVKNIPDRDKKIREAEQILRARLNFQGTRMNFSTDGSDCLWWLMVSNDVNCVRLVLSLIKADRWKEDIPRLLTGALQRQHQGRWDLTVANAWGVLALDRFSAKYESVPVSGETDAMLAGQKKTAEWTPAPQGTDINLSWPAKKDELVVTHRGKGKPWATISSRAAIPLTAPLSSGYKVKKTITPVEQKNQGKWSVGDVYRVRLEVEAQADQTWVVVNDPVPAGVTILGGGLARDSQLLTSGEKSGGWTYPVFQERSFEAFRAYYEYVPKGKFTVEYTIRVNQNGTFNLPSTRVEALYSPEMFGEVPNKAVEIGQ